VYGKHFVYQKIDIIILTTLNPAMIAYLARVLLFMAGTDLG